MDIRQVIRIIDDVTWQDHGRHYGKIIPARNMAKAALEKQISKEPIKKERTLDEGATTYWHICPSCKSRGLLGRWHQQLKYCPNCGQALKWSD